MKVRPASTHDTAAITAAYIESWRAGYQGLLTDAEIEIEARQRSGYDWHAAIADSDRVVLVAENDDEIIGVAECEHNPRASRLPELEMLYVVPSAWGTGAASALLEAALVAVHRAGHRTVWLRVVEAQARARRFYEREGWQLDEQKAPDSNGLYRLLHYRRDL